MSSEKYDVLVIGAGLFGLTFAERCANALGLNVLVIEKRDQIGGNCISYFDEFSGIEVHKYGPHVFHSHRTEFWEYIQKFCNIRPYKHFVHTTLTFDDGHSEVYSLPVNLHTINQFFRTNYSPQEAQKFIENQIGNPSENIGFKSVKDALSNDNLENFGIQMLGRDLFQAFIQGYTERQWKTPANKLPASYLGRIKIRYNYQSVFLDNKPMALPIEGFDFFFNQIIDSAKGNITVELGKTISRTSIEKYNCPTLVTSPIDEFYDYEFGELGWRSMEFRAERFNVSDYQGCAQMNFANREVPYNRICEYKHFNYEHYKTSSVAKDRTIIVKEYPVDYTRNNDAYYPIRSQEDLEKLKLYEAKAATDLKVHQIMFGGRLGLYQYLDMDQTVHKAFGLVRLFQNFLDTSSLQPIGRS